MNFNGNSAIKKIFKGGNLYSILKNGAVWKDVTGEPIHAHGGCIIFYNGYYYWYGEDRREDYYVRCYRARNLTD